MKQALIFPLKVWLKGIFLAFIGMWETHLYTGLAREDHYYAKSLATMIKLAILSPAYAVPFFLSVWVLLTMHWTKVTQKSVLCVLTFGLSWLPFMFFVFLTSWFKPFPNDVKRDIIVYALLNCSCIWFYRLMPLGDELSTQSDR